MVSRDVIFYFLWYDVYAEAVIYKKSLLFSRFIVFFFFSELHNGGDRVNLTKCDTGEWNEKCHYASDTLFEWAHG